MKIIRTKNYINQVKAQVGQLTQNTLQIVKGPSQKPFAWIVFKTPKTTAQALGLAQTIQRMTRDRKYAWGWTGKVESQRIGFEWVGMLPLPEDATEILNQAAITAGAYR